MNTAPIPRSLCVAMVLQFGLGGAVMPFISIWFRDRGLDFGRISQIFLASSSTLLVFPFLWGMLADRFIPMNRLFTLLNVLALVALVFLAFQKTFAGLLISFTLFYACFNPTLTLINALSFHHLQNPRDQFGLVRAWGSIGWIIPSLPIYLWMAGTNNQDLDFVLNMGIAASAGMIAMTLFLPHTPPGTGASGISGQTVGYWPAIKCLLRDPNYLTILISFFLVSASFSILVFYSPPLLEDLGVPRRWIGPIQCIGVVLEIALFQNRSQLLKNWGYAAPILFGCACLFVRQLLFVFSESAWLLSASYLLAGMVIVFYHIGTSILVNAIAGREVRATAQSLLIFFGSGMGPMFANWVAGRLAASSGQNLRPVFFFATVLAAMAALLIAFRRKQLDEATQSRTISRSFEPAAS